MTAIQYAKTEILAGRFANLTIQHIAGAFYLGDNDYNLLKGKSFATKEAATQARSKVIEKALKAL